MNQLITDISNFTRLKAEIELEKNEYIKLNNFFDEIPEIFTNNNKEVKLIFKKHKDNFEQQSVFNVQYVIINGICVMLL